jgi:hypothetical protein
MAEVTPVDLGLFAESIRISGVSGQDSAAEAPSMESARRPVEGRS